MKKMVMAAVLAMSGCIGAPFEAAEETCAPPEVIVVHEGDIVPPPAPTVVVDAPLPLPLDAADAGTRRGR